MTGDLLVLSGRFVEEVRLMENAKVSVKDLYASVALLVGNPLQLCFQSEQEARSFASEVRQRALMKKEMLQLADQAKDLREICTLGEGMSRVASARSARSARSAARAREEQTRKSLAVPQGVPMYALSPSPSGDLPGLDRGASWLQSSSSQLPASPARPHIPKLQISRANSLPSPRPPQRQQQRRHSHSHEDLQASPTDPNSFASKVFMGLGLHAAKAGLVAETRVDVLKTKFERHAFGGGGSSASSSTSL